MSDAPVCMAKILLDNLVLRPFRALDRVMTVSQGYRPGLKYSAPLGPGRLSWVKARHSIEPFLENGLIRCYRWS